MSDHSDSDSSPKGSDPESGSSDGVLVELPANPDQEENSGILVNIDGSEGQEEMFEDATDEPATPGEILTARSGLEESIALIEFGETSSGDELAKIKIKLEDSLSDCKKYREEREVFGREVANLRRQLLEMLNNTNKDSLASLNEETLIPLPTPLHAMLNDCSKFALHLKTLISDAPGNDLSEKQREIEDLKMKNIENVVSKDVIFLYLGNMHDSWSQTLNERLLPCLNTVLGETEGSLESTGTGNDVLSLLENKTLLLVERQKEILSQIDQLKQYLAGFKPEFENSNPIDSTRVLNIALEELVATKKLEKQNKGLMNQIEKLKANLDATNNEISKIKGELTQAENKYLAIKEKLSMAVTKGKSLVQTRDSLKHTLAEKNSEIEKYMGELKEKSDLLQLNERLLEEKINELNEKSDLLQKSENLLEEKTSELKEKSDLFEKLLEEKASELKEKSDLLQMNERLLEEKINELKEKSDSLQLSEVMVEELQKFVEVKISDLREKSSELHASEVKIEELEKLLEEKSNELNQKSSELEEKLSELETSEINLKEVERLLEEKTSELVIELQGKTSELQLSEGKLNEVERLLEEKNIELEKCFLESQAIQGNLKEVEKCFLELQVSEGRVKEFEKLLEEKRNENEKCLLELQESEGRVKEVEKLLEEKEKVNEKCLLELQESDGRVKELENLLEEKKNELEKCLLELQENSGELQTREISQVTIQELQKVLEEKTNELEKYTHNLQASEDNIKELKKILEEKNNELEKSNLDLQESEDNIKELKKVLEEKTSELEKSKLDLQESEDNIIELKKVLEEKTNELEKSKLDLQESEDNIKELKKVLDEKTSELEKSKLDLQESEDNIKELKKVLEEKTDELEKSFNESKERSIELESFKASSNELSEIQSTIASLSKKENVLNQIETILSDFNYPDNLGLLEPVQKVQWFVEQKDLSDEIFLEHCKIKEDLVKMQDENSNLEVKSSNLSEEIDVLKNSLLVEKEERDVLSNELEQILAKNSNLEVKLSNLSEEIEGLQNSLLVEKQEKDVVSKELKQILAKNSNLEVKLSNLSEEIEGLKNSFLEEKQEKDVILAKYQKSSEELSLVNSHKDELIKALEESFKITVDHENPNSVIDGIKARAKSSFDHSENFEKLQGVLNEKDQELILCKKLLEESNNKSEVERLNNELGKLSEQLLNLKNEKELLQKDFEKLEEKNALVREKLSLAVKKGKGLVQEREGFKHALDEKNSQIENLKIEVQSKDSILQNLKIEMQSKDLNIQNLREQIERLSTQLTDVDELETEIGSLKQSLNELIDLLDDINVPIGTSFKSPIQKMNWVKKHIGEFEFLRVNNEKERENYNLKSQMLENEVNKTKELVSNISKQKEEILNKKLIVEKEFEKIKLELSTNTNKLTDAFMKIKTLEEAYSQAKNVISLLDNTKNEIEIKHEKEVSELNARLNELRESNNGLERNLLEKNKEFENFKEILSDDSLLYLVNDEFRNKINSLRGMGLLMHEMHKQFNAKGYIIDPSIEVSGFAKFLSLPSYDKFINERNSRNKNKNFSEGKSVNSLSEGINEKSKYITNYFKDLSNYMDDHITLMSQALHATSEEFFHMMDSEETLKFDLEKLEDNNETLKFDLKKLEDINKTQEEKLRAFSGEMNDLRAKLEKSESNDNKLYEDRIYTLEKDNLSLNGVCEELKNKIESYEAKESSTKDRGISGLLFSEQEMEALIEKINKLDISFIKNTNFSNPLEKIYYIINQFIPLHQKISDLNHQKNDLQLSLSNLKGEYETIYTTLEKLVHKLVQLGGGKDNSQDQKLNSAMAILSFLERVVVNLIVEYDNSKNKLIEMEGKLKTREKMVNELNGRVKMLEDSHNFLVSQNEIVKERGLVESSSARNSDTNEIEELGPLGKSAMTTANRSSTRKASSDHVILNIGTETERLISAEETEDKGHVFKSLNTSGLIPARGKFIADKVDSAWVSGGRVLMSQPRARLGLVAYCIFLHLWFLGSIVF